MKSGELLEALRFAGRWLSIRDRDRSLVVTYEGFMDDPIGTLAAMNRLFALELPEAALTEIYRRAAPLTDRETNGYRHDRRIYPFGWTGRAGVWRQYFSPDNVATFKAIFTAFCTTCPWGEAISEVYPDLEEKSTPRRAAESRGAEWRK
ncbi:MAG: hypothetical protein ACYS0D_02525, partial [Planctomycetota bacterium]|jgi:hypothetical protein